MSTQKSFSEKWNLLKKSKNKIRDVYSYLLGNYRFELYYNGKYHWLMRKHIREQIDLRLLSTDHVCMEKGECKMCGCDIPGLQMANKACDKPCYPKMVNRRKWNILLNGGTVNEPVIVNGKFVRKQYWKIADGTFKKIDDTNMSWQKRKIDLGRIKPASTNTVVFQYTGIHTTSPVISKPDCSCTKIVWNNQNRTVTVTYKAPKLQPKAPEKPVSKTISVTFPNQNPDKLTFFATVTH